MDHHSTACPPSDKYEVNLRQDVPYPSLADAFRLFGCNMFSIAGVHQYRLFQASPTRRQKITLSLL